MGLGKPKFRDEVAERSRGSGRRDGPRVDARRRRHPLRRDVAHARQGPQHQITGQLGSVMKESAARRCPTCAATRNELGIDPEFLEKIDLHVHVPAGARARRTAQRRRHHLHRHHLAPHGAPGAQRHAMTGEITLRGVVLPVGGIKEKVLAAHRAGGTGPRHSPASAPSAGAGRARAGASRRTARSRARPCPQLWLQPGGRQGARGARLKAAVDLQRVLLRAAQLDARSRHGSIFFRPAWNLSMGRAYRTLLARGARARWARAVGGLCESWVGWGSWGWGSWWPVAATRRRSRRPRAAAPCRGLGEDRGGEALRGRHGPEPGRVQHGGA
jgi:hypothetical protein